MNELDSMVASVNNGNAILPGVEKLKYTFLNVHGFWVTRFDVCAGRGFNDRDSFVEITGYQAAIDYLKKTGWHWTKK